MGDALAELELVLRSSKEKLTREEEYVLQSCKAKAIRSFAFGACLASGITWIATRRLAYSHRFNLSGGAAIIFGFWRFDRSIDSCLDQILALDGSRIQRELAKLALTKYQDHPSIMHLVKQHFYSEKVFSDTSPEKPTSRWRQRHFYGDITDYRPCEDEQEHVNESNPNNVTNSEPEVTEEKHTSISNANTKMGEGFIANPLDCILGYSGAEEERASESLNISSREHSRAQRKSRHRKKRHIKDAPLNVENVDAC